MPHTVHPYAHRLGIIRDWKSRWFGVKDKYKESLKEDFIIRDFLEKRLQGFYASDILIERSRNALRIIIETSRPGLIIGRSGEGAVKLREDLIKKLKKEKLVLNQELKIDIKEVRSPEANAAIVSQMVAEALEKRMPFRRVLKQSLDKIIANRDVKGAKIQISGRLGGALIARSENRKSGRLPLQTLRADIDFARREARLPYGNLGIKVWIYKGDIFADKSGKAKINS